MTGPEVHLRAVEPDDLEMLYEWENDPEIWHLGNTLAPFSHFVLEQYLLNAQHDIYTNKQLRLMIDLNDAGNSIPTIGSIDLFDFDPINHRAGVGILITAAYRSKGYASEALGLLKNYAFTVLELHQLFANIETENKVSLALFNKQGFEKCGEKKDWLRHSGNWHNELMLQCINPKGA